MQQIILIKGGLVDIKDWQRLYDVEDDRVGRFFELTEFPKEFKLAEPLIRLIDVTRVLYNSPLVINSSYRNQKEQDRLKREGYRTATNSPHLKGMAVDIDTLTADGTRKLADTLKQASKLLGYKIRIGYNDYLKNGYTFVHVDVTPMYYGKGRPYRKKHHPEQWEKEINW